MTQGVLDGPPVVAITQAVVTALDNALSVPVLWGPPTGTVPVEFVSVGYGLAEKSWEGEREWVGAGRVTVDEDFNLELCIQSMASSGPDLKPAFDRSIEIAKEVEAALREDTGLSSAETLAQIRNLKFSKALGQYFRADKSRGHRLFLTITGIARF